MSTAVTKLGKQEVYAFLFSPRTQTQPTNLILSFPLPPRFSSYVPPLSPILFIYATFKNLNLFLTIMANKEKGEEEMFSMLAVDSRECESKRLRGVLYEKRLKEFPFHIWTNYHRAFADQRTFLPTHTVPILLHEVIRSPNISLQINRVAHFKVDK
ncbi:hypothetical protein Cgig2_020758 [Carnegiea gigantea]|uniref:Uncharacterized protein n=1 Tax=Carnegiea gigantea TaxID=171969 RepID=A0A9Q1K284_9CARY|nr:hypothetical protein Cgig2_020758 [Carnegiea gigantea]